MNTKELKIQMLLAEKSVDDLCAALGISRAAWFRKISGKSKFKQPEIVCLRRALNLDDQTTIDIFFNDKVS